VTRAVVAAVAIAAAVVFAALYFTKDTRVVEKRVVAKPCGDQRLFGHIASLERKGGRYELRFDPAWFTTGATANDAAGEVVPNDNYVVDESRRTFLYLVPASTHVTVLTNGKRAHGTLYATPVSVDELAQLTRGEKPVKLFESLETGFWMRIRGDTACALDQQYRP
jgi:hypothetical protein